MYSAFFKKGSIICQHIHCSIIGRYLPICGHSNNQRHLQCSTRCGVLDFNSKMGKKLYKNNRILQVPYMKDVRIHSWLQMGTIQINFSECILKNTIQYLIYFVVIILVSVSLHFRYDVQAKLNTGCVVGSLGYYV